ncbi:conserved membrane hypothetical protein [Candidatus Sulfotelmatomonas gaucii]|uniref:NnrS family protein n=1 Tax=Candidatus Sulfuritelmatomonas gaucii TaxID=2043161 RepID=A0A2N9LUI1_9BACT|nr:conserved membrane hypothetical protein [Candidatus Sulfotelmatomonas gaucii]
MSAIPQTMPILDQAGAGVLRTIVARERQKSLMLRAWIAAGLFYMALPGTLLGFSNLLAISAHHGLGSLPAAWIQGHGHAQVFGWIGSFVLGIGFYSQPSHGRSAIRIPLACFLLWTSGVGMRWVASIYGWHWRTLFIISASFELIAILLFLAAASRHKLPDSSRPGHGKPRMELWMVAVLLSTAGLAATVIFNAVECIRLAVNGAAIAFPHALDQRFLVLLGWGFLALVVWGFSARWLPTFLAISKPDPRLFQLALILDFAGVLAGVSGWTRAATILLACGAITICFALHLTERPHGTAKVQGIHPSFPTFVRLAYAWLVIAGLMSIWAAFADEHGGIWGASRHALTVGFAATMVFTIGPRILPHFAGFYGVFSKRLMFAALLLLQIGCTLRVLSEPLAYEGIASFAWKTLPISGVLELTGVLVFAANIVLTFAFGRKALAPAVQPGI